jgi:hypothetical protein
LASRLSGGARERAERVAEAPADGAVPELTTADAVEDGDKAAHAARVAVPAALAEAVVRAARAVEGSGT